MAWWLDTQRAQSSASRRRLEEVRVAGDLLPDAGHRVGGAGGGQLAVAVTAEQVLLDDLLGLRQPGEESGGAEHRCDFAHQT